MDRRHSCIQLKVFEYKRIFVGLFRPHDRIASTQPHLLTTVSINCKAEWTRRKLPRIQVSRANLIPPPPPDSISTSRYERALNFLKRRYPICAIVAV